VFSRKRRGIDRLITGSESHAIVPPFPSPSQAAGAAQIFGAIGKPHRFAALTGFERAVRYRARSPDSPGHSEAMRCKAPSGPLAARPIPGNTPRPVAVPAMLRGPVRNKTYNAVISMTACSRELLRCLAAVALLLLGSGAFGAAGIEDSLGVVSETNREATASQQKIDRLALEARDLLEEYRTLRDGSEYQAAYTRELEELDRAQQERIENLRAQIARARITRQRIVPLMRSMAEALEKFVVLDLPFHHEERIGAVLQLQRRLGSPELSVSARFRLLLEAYQLELDYGNRIEAWRGPLNWRGEERSVQYLRVGRAALYFQTLDGSASGYWDREAQDWMPLDPQFNRPLARALRVAQNVTAPELLQLPMSVPEHAQ